MRDLSIPGGSWGAAYPGGLYAVTVPGQHVETHAGPIPFPEGIEPIHLDVTNVGSRRGAEVVQVYVHDVQSRLPRIITGAELDRLSDGELQQALQDEVIFARVSPEHKLRLVKVLQAEGVVSRERGRGTFVRSPTFEQPTVDPPEVGEDQTGVSAPPS